MLISEWRGRKDLETEHAAPHSGTRLTLLSRQRSMYLARRGSRSAILIAPAAEARGPAVRHLRRQIRALVARRALSNVEGALQPVFCEIGFHYLRRRHCQVERSVSRIEWLGDPLATRCDVESKRTLRLQWSSHYDAPTRMSWQWISQSIHGVGIAAAGEGGEVAKRFLATVLKRRAPIVPQLFWGTFKGNSSVKPLNIRS